MHEQNVRNSGEKAPVIGIDLGTSNCCVALWCNDSMDIIRNVQGDRLTPSVISLHSGGKIETIVVGAPARRQAVMNPTDTISEVKRLIGQRFSSPEVTAARSILPYSIVEATNGDAWVELKGKQFSPQEIQAYILEELVSAASNFIGKQVESAVITVPAFYDETQRQAVRDSAAIAGIEVSRILSEPTAAALSYGYLQMDKRRIAIVDLGGGTLDVTVMSVDRGRFVVLATDGDNLLGGADFDRVIAKHFSDILQSQHGLDVSCDPVAMQRLLEAAESAKKTLTELSVAEISLPYLAQDGANPVDFNTKLTIEEYEKLVQNLVDRIEAPCTAAVTQAGLRPSELDDVILIGGMTRSPVVNKRIGALFQRRPLLRINPDEAVAMGAALLGASIAGDTDQIHFVDVAARTVGLRAAGDTYVPLIQKSSRLPATCRKGFRTTRDNQQSFELDILQGESPTASQNRKLSHISIAPISQKPAGQVMLELRIEMNATGALVVHAKEKGASEELQSQIQPFSGLTENQVIDLAAQHKRQQKRVASTPAPSLDGFSMKLTTSSHKRTVADTEASKKEALRKRAQAAEQLELAKKKAATTRASAKLSTPAISPVQFKTKSHRQSMATPTPSVLPIAETAISPLAQPEKAGLPTASAPQEGRSMKAWIAAAILVLAVSVAAVAFSFL